MWAILAAPFLLSNDLRKIQPEIKELMLNRDVIAIDQDALGIQGRLISKSNNIEIWARPVLPIVRGEHSYAVAFVSRRTDGHPYSIEVTLKSLHLGNRHGYEVKVKVQFVSTCMMMTNFRFQDLFDSNRPSFKFEQSDSFEERVNPSGANFYKFVPI